MSSGSLGTADAIRELHQAAFMEYVAQLEHLPSRWLLRQKFEKERLHLLCSDSDVCSMTIQKFRV